MRTTLFFSPALTLALVLALAGCAAPESTAPAAQAPSPPDSSDVAQQETMSPAPLVEIRNARQPLPGVLTGGQPTDEELAEVAEKGYRTVVNLRSEAEVAETSEPETVEGLGLRYVGIPMAGAAGLTAENAAALDAVLADPSSYPVLIHCASGNRVGGLLALRAHQQLGAEASEALAQGLEAGLTSLEPAVREALALPPAGD